ncbi:hypothetical protein MBLNU457_g0717t2 [Dothideomycetes sp. NU457]
MDDLQKRQSRDCPSGFQWFSCNLAGNTFAGCCSVDPCNPNGGCPITARPPTTTTSTSISSSALIGASTAPSSLILTTSSTSPSTASTLSSTTTSTISENAATTTNGIPSAQPNVTPASTTDVGQSAGKESIGAIVGAAIGGFLGLLLILALVACVFYRRRRQQAKRKSATITRRKSMEPLHGDDGQHIFAPFGGFYRGTDDQHAEKQNADVPGITSASDGHTYQYLDTDSSEPSPAKNRISQLDGSPISELADTSPVHPHGFVAQPQYIAYSPARNSTKVSPITPTGDGALRSQHARSWQDYAASGTNSPAPNLTSNASPKTRADSPDPRTWIYE